MSTIHQSDYCICCQLPSVGNRLLDYDFNISAFYFPLLNMCKLIDEFFKKLCVKLTYNMNV